MWSKKRTSVVKMQGARTKKGQPKGKEAARRQPVGGWKNYSRGINECFILHASRGIQGRKPVELEAKGEGW